MAEIRVKIKRPIQLIIDNKSTINLKNNSLSHGRSKHIETIFHFLREQVNNGKMKLIYCSIKLQVAEIYPSL